MNVDNINNIYIGDKQATAWLGDKPVIGDFVEIIIIHNGFGKVKYKHHVYGSRNGIGIDADKYITIIKVPRNKSCTLTLIPDSNKGCNYGEWQDSNGTQLNDNIDYIFTPTDNTRLNAWFGLDKYNLVSAVIPDVIEPFPTVPIRKIIDTGTIGTNWSPRCYPFTFKKKQNDVLFYKFTKLQYSSDALINLDAELYRIDNISNIKPNLPYILIGNQNNISNFEFEYCQYVGFRRSYIEFEAVSPNRPNILIINVTTSGIIHQNSAPGVLYIGGNSNFTKCRVDGTKFRYFRLVFAPKNIINEPQFIEDLDNTGGQLPPTPDIY